MLFAVGRAVHKTKLPRTVTGLWLGRAGKYQLICIIKILGHHSTVKPNLADQGTETVDQNTSGADLSSIGFPWNEPSFFCRIHVRQPQPHHFQRWGDCFPAIDKLEIFFGRETTCLSLYATIRTRCCRTSLSKRTPMHIFFCWRFTSIDSYKRNSSRTNEVYAHCLE